MCLSDYSAMLPQALANDYIDDHTLTSLEEWRKDPSDLGQVFAKIIKKEYRISERPFLNPIFNYLH
jgi:hypothetical protein